MAGRNVRIIHCADIHLDSPLRGLAAHDGAPADDIRGAARRAFSGLIDLCVGERVDLLLIAGDLFDGDWRDFQTGLFFAGQMARAARAGVRVVIVRGNHDSESTLSRSLSLPDSVRVLASHEPETVVYDDLGVAVHGQSFRTAKEDGNLAAGYPPPRQGMVNIGLLHTAIGGYEGHDTYAPCSLAQLIGHDYDYWALGHVHQHMILNRDPWVVFPGNLQGRHAREIGPKGAVELRITDGMIAAVEFRPFDVLRWQAATVDVSGAETRDEALDRVRTVLEGLWSDCDGRPLAVRLTLTGACAAHRALQAEGAEVRHQTQAVALDVGEVWVEKVRLDTRPQVDRAALAEGSSPLASLLAMLDHFAEDEEGRALLGDQVKAMIEQLPADARLKREGLDGAVLADLLAAADGLILADISADGGAA